MERMHTAIALVLLVVVGWTTTGAAQAPNSRRCDTTRDRQFDFFVGEWDVFDRGGSTKAADVRVERILDGCVLREDYSDPSGLLGHSLSSFDTKTGEWQQTWVTNRGQLVVIHGVLEGKELAFTGWRHDGDVEVLVRARWIPEGASIRQKAETSADGGKTWRPWFDLDFRPRRR
jgi:hypothetical protein